MDLGGGSSEPTHLNENDETLEGTSSFDGIKIANTESCANEILDLGSVELAGVKTSTDLNGKEIGTETPVKSPSEVTETSPGNSGETPPATKKGYGLKKWRRIRRDFTKDESSGLDLNRILKRGPPNTAELLKPRNPSNEIKQENSAASAGSSIKSPDLLDGFAIKGSSLDSTIGVGSGFAVGMDSDNSGDRSSKSSTAASAPRLRNDAHMVMGSVRDKHRVKNPSGRSSSNAVQKVQQVKGRIETGKKFRGERVQVEKENSYSSIESDLRSSNVVFTQTGNVYGTRNRRQSEVCSNYDEDNSDKGQNSDPQSREGDQKDYYKENGGDIEDVSQNDVSAGISLEEKEEEIESHRIHSDWDPLIKSIISLQAVQEALENEITKFGELGKEHVLPLDDFIQSQGLPVDFVSSDPKTDKPNSCSYLHSDVTERNCIRPLEAQLIDLNQKVNHLERKLEEASAMLKVKESRVVELEDMLNRSGLQKEEESGSTLPYLQGKCREMETQLEDLFKKKIEAEIEYLLITRTTQKLKVDSEDQVSLFEEQKSLSLEQNQMLQKLRDAGSKASVLKRHVEELDASCEEILGTEEVLKMQNRVCKHTLCFLVQFMLLLLGFLLFLLQLFPQPSAVIPT